MSKQPSRFSDLGKEAAVAGCISVGDSFERVPSRCLIADAAFTHAGWRLIYSAARQIRVAAAPVCTESVNDFIGFHQLDGELQAAIDPARVVPWQRWPEFADISLAYCPTSRPLEYSLTELGRLFDKRRAAVIGERLASGELELPQA